MILMLQLNDTDTIHILTFLENMTTLIYIYIYYVYFLSIKIYIQAFY